MNAVYIPWAMTAIRHPFTERVYQFEAQTPLIDVSRFFAQFGATLRWNPKTHHLEINR